MLSCVPSGLVVPQLRRLRLLRALTQEDLAERAVVDRSTVVRAEAGLAIRISSVRKLARALKVSTEELQRPED